MNKLLNKQSSIALGNSWKGDPRTELTGESWSVAYALRKATGVSHFIRQKSVHHRINQLRIMSNISSHFSKAKTTRFGK